MKVMLRSKLHDQRDLDWNSFPIKSRSGYQAMSWRPREGMMRAAPPPCQPCRVPHILYEKRINSKAFWRWNLLHEFLSITSKEHAVKNMLCRGALESKVQRLLHHPALRWRAIKKKKKKSAGVGAQNVVRGGGRRSRLLPSPARWFTSHPGECLW